MPCELFTFDHACDMPHWLGLIIEIIIGLIISAIFFKRQDDQTKKHNRIFNNRHNHAYYSIRDSLEAIFVEIQSIEVINDRYYHRPTLDLETAYVDSINRLEEEKNNLQIICNSSRDVLEPRDDVRISRDIKFITTLIEQARNNISYTEVFDRVMNSTIELLNLIPLVDDDGIN